MFKPRSNCFNSGLFITKNGVLNREAVTVYNYKAYIHVRDNNCNGFPS